MSTFPALEAALDQAAHRHYARRRAPSVWLAAPVFAAALLALVFVLVRAPAQEGAQDPAVIVPERTLALSRALTAAPREPEQLVGHDALAGVAADIALGVPYPPEAHDTFAWERTPVGPYDMSSINYRNEVQSIVEYRAACFWVGFWDYAWRTGNEGALVAATTVLGDLPQWPSMRQQGSYWPSIAAAAAARDPVPLRRELDLNCARMTMPWGR